MPATVQCVMACYRASLRLYPTDLRFAYGKEMESVFEKLLHAEWESRGVRGILTIGSRAIYELLVVAIPGQILSERIIAPGLSLLSSSGILLSLVAVMMHPPRILTVQERLMKRNELYKNTHCVHDGVRGVCKPV
jgi:hypothetical protein